MTPLSFEGGTGAGGGAGVECRSCFYLWDLCFLRPTPGRTAQHAFRDQLSLPEGGYRSVLSQRTDGTRQVLLLPAPMRASRLLSLLGGAP